MLSYPFNKKRVQLNDNTSVLKIIAMITMLIDHCGAALFPQYRVLRIIGRLAFPLYAYCIAAGCVYTHDIGRYFSRVVVFALISQPIYVLALNHTNSLMYMYSFSEHPFKAVGYFYIYSWKDPSILLTLAIGIGAVSALRQKRIGIVALILILTYLLKSDIDYGLEGVTLILLMYMFIDIWYVSLPVVAAYMIWWGLKGSSYNFMGVSYGIQMYAALALPLIFIPMGEHFKMNKYIFYSFYPLHLLFIWVVKEFVM